MTKKVSLKKIQNLLILGRARANTESDPEFDLGMALNTGIAEKIIETMEKRLEIPEIKEFQDQVKKIEMANYVKDENGKPKRFPVPNRPDTFQYFCEDVHKKEEEIEGWLDNNQRVKKAIEANKKRREQMLNAEVEVEFHQISLSAAKQAHITPAMYSLLLDVGVLDVPAPKIPELPLEVVPDELPSEESAE